MIKKLIKDKRFWLIVGAVCLVACLCVALAMCGGNGEETPEDPTTDPTTGAAKVTYTVTVKNSSGMALAGVDVYVYTDSTQKELVWFAKTDAAGKMSFTDVESDNYIAVLDKIPTGYTAEDSYPLTGLETEIVLSAGQMNDENVQNLTYKLGDMMMDFSVTTPDGTVYTLSELLKEKDAVVLNFWYTNCGPCKIEFPYLQEAYEAYSDKIEVLALNPVDSDDAGIAAFQKDNGLTFPMAKVDESWAKIMQLTAYPTTVVIDRFGNITLIHKGYIDNAQTFKDVFAHFSAEDYEQKVIQDITEIETEAEVGTIDNPTEVGGVTSFEVTVKPGEVVYVNAYRVNEMYMQIKNSDAYVIYKDKTYKPSNGVVGLMVYCADTYTPASLGFGNSGDQTQTFTVTFSPLSGSYNNPYTMKLGTFTAKVSAGSEQGVYYSYKATADGILTLQCLSATKGVSYDYFLYNLDSGAMRNLGADSETLENGQKSVSIQVKKGQTVQICVSTLPDENHNYPAGSFELNASFTAGQVNAGPQVESATYTVTIKDNSGTPLSNVNISVDMGGSTMNFATNTQGVATAKLPKGTYTVTLTVPDGYTANTTTFTLTEASPSITVTLSKEKINMVNYTVKVKDNNGNAVSNVLLSIGGNYCTTDAAGTASVKLKEGSYPVTITVPDGYTSESTAFTFASGASELTITLTNQETSTPGGSDEPTPADVTYSVTVTDANGKKQSNVLVVIQKGSAQSAYGMTDANGTFTAKLPADNYTVSLNTDRYYSKSTAVLSAASPSVTIKFASEVDPSNVRGLYIINDNNTYILGVGNTHVELGTGKPYYSAENKNNCFFVFAPTQAGTYKIALDNPDVNLSLWSTPAFITHQKDASDSADNALTVDIKENQIGNVEYVLGIEVVSGITDVAVNITRVGNAGFDIEAQPWDTAWQSGYVPSKFSLNLGAGQKLTYVDVIKGTAEQYKVVYNTTDGYYHLGTADGPVLYVNLGPNAPYVSLQKMIRGDGAAGGAPLRKYFYDANGNFVKKEDYTACVDLYLDCLDNTHGVYPVTKDLAYIIQNAGEGWWDSDSPSYVIDGANEEIGWLFACCFVE